MKDQGLVCVAAMPTSANLVLPSGAGTLTFSFATSYPAVSDSITTFTTTLSTSQVEILINFDNAVIS